MRCWAGIVSTLTVLASAGCSRGEAAAAPKSSEKTPPARIVAAEGGGAPTLELTAEAVQRLGLETAVVERVEAQQVATLPAELVLPAGARLELRAPFAGRVRRASAAAHPGQVVEAGATLLALEPLLSPESERAASLQRAQLEQTTSQLALSRAENAGALERAGARLEAATVAHERARALLEAEAGSVRARDEAQAEERSARAELAALERSRIALEAWTPPGTLATPPALELRAPQAATLVEARVTADQVVPAGELLVVLERRDVLWVRVPVRDEALVAADAITVSDLAGTWTHPARASAAPGSAHFAAATVDLWFALEEAADLRPGQRVVARIPVNGRVTRLAVPRSALVFDAQGAGWVYLHLGGTSYRRAAVDFERSEDDLALLAHGPEPGTAVVRTGVAELFGTEFGTGK
jgi:biotin carboxyl carrier protein